MKESYYDSLLKEIAHNKEKLSQQRPLGETQLRNLREYIFTNVIYNSNAMEGNTLTLSETAVILSDGVTVRGKSMREHLEVINHKEALESMEIMIKKKMEISLRVIKDIHYLITKSVLPTEECGKFRKFDVMVTGSSTPRPSHINIRRLMDSLFSEYDNIKTFTNAIEAMSWFHSRLLYIHPFSDGNGRTARVILNFMLLKEGYPFIIFPVDTKIDYNEALENSYVSGNYFDIQIYIAERLLESFKLYLSLN